MKFETNFTFDKLNHDKDNETHMVISATAPKINWQEERPPICVFPVVDVSGSMSGDKLDYAKKSALKLVEHLNDNDYAGFAIFHDSVDLIYPVTKMTSAKKEELKARIGDVHVQGCTNFSGGMMMGLEQINTADLPENIILRVIMLTDGHANRGIAIDHQSLVNLLTNNLGAATLSAFGYGVGANQELLMDLASVGKGNYAFIENPDDALSAFAKELGGLLSTYAQDLNIEITVNNGHRIKSVVSDVDVEGDEKSVKINLPEILSEERRDVVVEMLLSKQTKALPRKMTVADVTMVYNILDKEGKVTKEKIHSKAKVQFVKPGDEQQKPHKEYDEIVGLAQLVRTQIEAEEHAKQGNYHKGVIIYKNLCDSLDSRGLTGHSNFARRVQQKVSSAEEYTKGSVYLNSAKAGMKRMYGASGMSADVIDDCAMDFGLSRTSNDAQDSLTKSFTTNDIKVVTADVGTGTGNKVIIKQEPIKQEPTSNSDADDKKVEDNLKDTFQEAFITLSSLTKKKSTRW